MGRVVGKFEAESEVEGMELGLVTRAKAFSFRALASFFRRSRVAENLTNRVSAVESQLAIYRKLLEELERRTNGYARNEILEVLWKLTPTRPVDTNFVRYGNEADGGYVLVDDIKATDVIFSIGLGDDISFDTEIEPHAHNVVLVDHTVPNFMVPTGKFDFFDIPLVPKESDTGVTLSWLLRTFPGDDHILKIDIEGAEWGVLDQISLEDLAAFRQIAVEFHGLTDFADVERLNLVKRVFDRLRISHAPVLVHANNCADFLLIGGIAVADVIEVTWLRRDSYSLAPGMDPLISALFLPNTRSRIDIGDAWFHEILRRNDLASHSNDQIVEKEHL